ncbi:transcriptional regulator [Streptomyces africanus]|uniref:transcriptional regulator n=1 Tax=Streptomyces africanus TaxID=231024 RepID=UPI000A364C38|nr:transcriptional regulator [Streptomyces africanus]
MTDAAGTFAAAFGALFVAHSVGDHWVQTSWQAARKGDRSRTGLVACGRHVLGLTATKIVLLLVAVAVLGLDVSVTGVAVGLGLDAATHYWADRRHTLAGLSKVCRKTEFHVLGTPAHEHHPVDAGGKFAPTLGTGAYALDQSFHHLWLFVAALIIAAV